MFFGGKNKGDSEAVLIINLNSVGVSASLVLLKKGDRPKVIFPIFEPIGLHDTPDAVLQEKALASALEKAMTRISHDGIRHLSSAGFGLRVRDVLCFISPLWHVSKVKDIHIDFKDGGLLWAEDVADLLEKEGEAFLSETAHSAGGHRPSFEVFEKRIMKFFLNDYPTSAPYGAKCRYADMPVFLSAGHKTIMDSSRSAIHRHFPHANVSFHSSVFASYVAIRDYYPDKDDFLLVIISAENTEVVVVRRDIIVESISFPLGEGLLVRSVVKKMPKIDPKVALSVLRMRSEYSLNDSAHNKISDALSKMQDDWMRAFADALANLSSEIFLPRDMLVLGESIQSGSFFGSLISNNFESIKKNIADWNIEPVDGSFAGAFVSKDSSLDILPVSALSSYYANRHFETGERE